jgi:tetratricopeptide (TPR) repeat protein
VVLRGAAGCVLFFVNARFRLPAAPLLVVLGAGGIVGLVRAIREAPRTVVVPGGIALLLAVAAFSNPYRVPKDPAPTAYVLLAEAERNHGEPVRALRWIDHALEVEPGLYVAHMARLDLLRSMGRQAEALQAAERMLAVRPDDAGLLQRAAILRDLAGDPAGGLTLLERALAIEPTLPGARLDRAILLIRSGRVAEARSGLVALADQGTEAERARARRVLAELDAGTLRPATPSRASESGR